MLMSSKSNGPKPSIKDVALACGVSTATVSRVLNDRNSEVGPETRVRVLATVRRMSYKPGRSFSAPAHPETLTLGIVSGIYAKELIAPGYFHEVVQAIQVATDDLGQNALLFAGHLFRSELNQSLRIYCDGRCEGLLVVAPTVGSPLVQSLAARGIPFVLIGDTAEDEQTSYCTLDYMAAACAAVEELLRLGHRRIALLRGPSDIRATHQREAGYRQALAAGGITVDERLLFSAPPHNDEDRDSHKLWLKSIMALPPEERPTALFCYTDGHAVAVQETLTKIGLSVPADVSLIGFDDTLAADCDPPLTSVRQPYLEIGRQAVVSLLAQIRGDLSVPQRVLFHEELICRASVASPRK